MQPIYVMVTNPYQWQNISSLLPQFGGQLHEEVSVFIEKSAAVFHDLNTPYEAWLRLAQHQLRGEARRWWNEYGEFIAGWSELCVALRRRYDSPSRLGDINREFYASEHDTSEAIELFFRKKIRLHQRLRNPLQEQELINLLIDQSHWTLRPLIRIARPRTLEDLIDISRTLEADLSAEPISTPRRETIAAPQTHNLGDALPHYHDRYFHQDCPVLQRNSPEIPQVDKSQSEVEHQHVLLNSDVTNGTNHKTTASWELTPTPDDEENGSTPTVLSAEAHVVPTHTRPSTDHPTPQQPMGIDSRSITLAEPEQSTTRDSPQGTPDASGTPNQGPQLLATSASLSDWKQETAVIPTSTDSSVPLLRHSSVHTLNITKPFKRQHDKTKSTNQNTPGNEVTHHGSLDVRLSTRCLTPTNIQKVTTGEQEFIKNNKKKKKKPHLQTKSTHVNISS